jgi:hypothetical protein
MDNTRSPRGTRGTREEGMARRPLEMAHISLCRQQQRQLRATRRPNRRTAHHNLGRQPNWHKGTRTCKCYPPQIGCSSACMVIQSTKMMAGISTAGLGELQINCGSGCTDALRPATWPCMTCRPGNGRLAFSRCRPSPLQFGEGTSERSRM